MSRMESTITIPQELVNVNSGLVTVKGKRNINSKVDADITVAIADGVITLSSTDHKRHRYFTVIPRFNC